jgi:hypothetical protein
MDKYTFPFKSCEIPTGKGISQPYSTTVNIILCLLIFYFLLQSNHFYSTLFLFSVFAFSAFHTFSHFTHIESKYNIQFLFTHFSAIFATFCLLLLFQYITKRSLHPVYWCGLGFLYILDMILIRYGVSHIYNILLFVVILFMIMVLYYPYTSIQIQTNIKYIIGLSLITVFLQIIEVKYCKKMLEWVPGFPFHSVVEISAFFPIFFLCNTFYRI